MQINTDQYKVNIRYVHTCVVNIHYNGIKFESRKNKAEVCTQRIN
jgi:hypothetical protein